MILISDGKSVFHKIPQNHFPDGTLLSSFPHDIIPTMVEWRYESDAELFTLICIAKHYSNCSLKLILEYLPHARQDRVKKPEDVFTLKYFCEVINDLCFESVWVLDPHSNVSLALLDNVYTLPVEDLINRVIKEINDPELVAFYPDEGAMKRYSADINSLPYAFGIKKRDWATGKIEGLQLINESIVKDKNVLIIDDICSRGGTFYHSAKALKAAGAKNIYLYITHAENTMVDGEMYNDPDLIKTIFTTSSIFNKGIDRLDKVFIVN